MKKEIPLRRFWAACLCLALMITAAGDIAYAQSNEAAVVYISDSGNDSNDGSSVQTAVKTWEKAYELVPDESKIIVAGTSTVPDSFVPLSEKTVTISGDYDETDERGTLIPGEASMTALSFGADTVMENLIIDCSKNTSSIGMFSLYANGHDLTIGASMTMLPYPNSSYTPYPCVAAGSATIYPPLPTEPEAGNTIQIQSGQYTEIIPNGFADNTGLDAEIFLSGGVVVECLGVSECGENAEYYIIDGSADNPTQIKGIDSYNYGIVMGKLEVRDSGYLTLSGDGDFWDGWEDGGIYPASIIDLSVARGGTLCLMNSLSEGVTGDFYGGGTIIMDSGAKFAVPGAVHGETMIEIIPGKDTGEDVIDGVKLGTYITAGASGSGTFTLKNKIGAVIMPKDSQGKRNGSWSGLFLLLIRTALQTRTFLKIRFTADWCRVRKLPNLTALLPVTATGLTAGRRQYPKQYQPMLFTPLNGRMCMNGPHGSKMKTSIGKNVHSAAKQPKKKRISSAIGL